MAAKKGKKAVKAKQTKAQGKKGIVKVGVIDSIVKIIETKGPISKEEIGKALAKMYPDRDANGLLATVKAQLPTRILKGRDIKLNQTEDHLFSIGSKKAAQKDKAQLVKAPETKPETKEKPVEPGAPAKKQAFKAGKIVKKMIL